MKLISRFLSLTLLLAATLLYTGCKDDGEDTKSDQEIQLEALSKTWTLTSAELDNDPRTADFPNMKLTLSGTFVDENTIYDYSVTGTTPGPSPIPRSGKWKFGADPKTQIIRDPGTENFPITYSVSGTTLTLTFDCDACDYAGGGRVSTVNGQWELTFSGS
jgi:hypothetical protein